MTSFVLIALNLSVILGVEWAKLSKSIYTLTRKPECLKSLFCILAVINQFFGHMRGMEKEDAILNAVMVGWTAPYIDVRRAICRPLFLKSTSFHLVNRQSNGVLTKLIELVWKL